MNANPLSPLRVRLSAEVALNGIERQFPGEHTPGREIRVGDVVFDVNPSTRTACDFWIVYTASGPREVADCPAGNTLFVTLEPPSKKVYPRAFYRQFHRVMSYHPDDPHPRVSYSGSGLNWLVGYSYDAAEFVYGHRELSAMPWPQKQDRVSVVCSSLRRTEGQRRRLAFLDRMKAHFGERMVHHGKGFTPVSDKMEAIAPYAYHLVLENDRVPHYWSEKISDAYLGCAFPFYLGCPNLTDYFPREAFEPVDPDDAESAIATIERTMAEDRAARSRDVIDLCRERVLNDYNPFVCMARWAREFYRPGRREPTVIRAHRAFRDFPQNLAYRFRTRGHGPGTLRTAGMRYARPGM